MKFDISKRIILLSVAGSRAYHIHKEDSDVDMCGIAVTPTEHLLGYNHVFDQFQKLNQIFDDNGEFSKFQINIDEYQKAYNKPDILSLAKEKGCEGTIFSLQKFFVLATDNNPNIMDVLFSEDDSIVYSTIWGDKIRENKYLFLSKKARNTYAGYAISQLKRIQTHKKWLINPPHKPTRAEFGLAELPLINREYLNVVNSMIDKKMDGWEIDYTGMDSSVVIALQEQIQEVLSEIHIYTRDDKFYPAAKSLGFEENFIEYIKNERDYADAAKKYLQYEEWKVKRNKQRHELEAKFGYDTKHAAHLYRLMVVGEEVLTTGRLNVSRKGIDADHIVAIRNGIWSYDELIQFSEDQMKKIIEAEKTSVLPKAPDREKLEELCAEIQRHFIQS
jgi:uncharacterized protein